MAFATGSMATMRMMNGTLRKTFTITPSSLFSQRTGCMPFLSVTHRRMPTGRPIM
jgi:hypothetical protein